jgi:hypothetical protein
LQVVPDALFLVASKAFEAISSMCLHLKLDPDG